jgi:hypothetical protein
MNTTLFRGLKFLGLNTARLAGGPDHCSVNSIAKSVTVEAEANGLRRIPTASFPSRPFPNEREKPAWVIHHNLVQHLVTLRRLPSASVRTPSMSSRSRSMHRQRTSDGWRNPHRGAPWIIGTCCAVAAHRERHGGPPQAMRCLAVTRQRIRPLQIRPRRSGAQGAVPSRRLAGTTCSTHDACQERFDWPPASQS